MYNIAKKKEIQIYFFEKIESVLNFIFRDSEYSFWCITWFHHVIVFLLFSFIFFPKESFQFKLSLVFFFLWICLNFFFNGCILIRLERFILKDDSWCALYEILELFNIPKTTKNIHLTFFLFILFIYYFLIFKIFIKR
tara:strand:+ start:456 stop:869 length:414 start_codon:yes stop_codon:yes gene_type:complete